MRLIFLLLLIACNEKYPPPQTEICTTDDLKFQCADQRVNKGRSYTKLIESNYICTSSEDYDRLYAYCADMRKERIKLEKKQK